jgi:hypothetical protein
MVARRLLSSVRPSILIQKKRLILGRDEEKAEWTKAIRGGWGADGDQMLYQKFPNKLTVGVLTVTKCPADGFRNFIKASPLLSDSI